MAARRSQLEPLAAGGSRRAQICLDALEQMGSLLACAQLGITVCSVLLGAISEAALHHAGAGAGGRRAEALADGTLPSRWPCSSWSTCTWSSGR